MQGIIWLVRWDHSREGSSRQSFEEKFRLWICQIFVWR